jgi:DNA-binding NarL/FixJ family response regulator
MRKDTEYQETPLLKKEVKITSAEKEILQLIANGLSSREISLYRRTKLSTVKHQRWLVMNKLGLKNTAEVVRWVMEREGGKDR